MTLEFLLCSSKKNNEVLMSVVLQVGTFDNLLQLHLTSFITTTHLRPALLNPCQERQSKLCSHCKWCWTEL